MENPFLIPPRLLARAADDLAVLTRSMTQIPDLLVRLDQRAVELEAMFEKLLPVGRSVDRTARRAADGLEQLLARVDATDARIGEAIERIGALDRRAGELTRDASSTVSSAPSSRSTARGRRRRHDRSRDDRRPRPRRSTPGEDDRRDLTDAAATRSR